MTTNTDTKMKDGNSPIQTCLTQEQTRIQGILTSPLTDPKINLAMDQFSYLRGKHDCEIHKPTLEQIYGYFTEAKSLRKLFEKHLDYKHFDTIERLSADHFLMSTGFVRYSDRSKNEDDVEIYEDWWVNYDTGCFLFIEYIKDGGYIQYWNDSDDNPVSHRFDKESTDLLRRNPN